MPTAPKWCTCTNGAVKHTVYGDRMNRDNDFTGARLEVRHVLILQDLRTAELVIDRSFHLFRRANCYFHFADQVAIAPHHVARMDFADPRR